MTKSQAAAHESWLVRCSPRASGFSHEQSASIPLILQESADATCTQPRNPPSPLFLHTSFVAIRKNVCMYIYLFIYSWIIKIKITIFGSSGESNQGFSAVGVRRHNYHATYSCYVINFTDFLMPPPQSRIDLGHTPLSSCCTRHFSLPHHTPIFSRIHPLCGQGRHV